MSDEQATPQVFLIKYPASFQIKKLHNLTITIPNSGNIKLKQKDTEEVIAINELEDELNSNLASKVMILERTTKNKAAVSKTLRVNKILKLRKCPTKLSTKAKSQSAQ